MNKTIFLFILVLFICSIVFAYPHRGNSFSLNENVKTTDFIYQGSNLVYAPVLIRINPNGTISYKPTNGCYNGACVSACESARLRDLFLWGCN